MGGAPNRYEYDRSNRHRNGRSFEKASSCSVPNFLNREPTGSSPLSGLIGCYSRFSPAMASEEACRHGSWIFKVQRHQPLRLICDLPFLLEAPHSSSYLGWNWKTIPKRKRKLF